MQKNILDESKHVPLFILVLGLLLFKPGPGILLGSISVRLIPMIVLFVVLCIVGVISFNQMKNNQNPLEFSQLKKDRVILYLFLSVISLFISTIVGMIKFPEYTSITDAIEIYRYIFYFAFYFLAKTIKIETIKQIIKPVVIMIVIIEIFGVFQFFNLLNINHHIGLLYTSSESLFKMITHQHRIGSTFLNPNLYGSFLLIVTSLLLAYLTIGNNNKKSLFVYPLVFLTIISVYFTTSRTAVITVFGIIVYWILIRFLFRYTKFSATLKEGLFVLTIFIAIGFLLVPNIKYLDYAATQITSNLDFGSEKVDEGAESDVEDPNSEEDQNDNVGKIKKSVESVSSFKSREYYWNLNYEQYKKSPLFGSGPMKSEFVSFADNSYLYILARYGILGMVIFTLFYGFLYIKTLINSRKQNNSNQIISLSINFIIVGYVVMGLVSEVWFNLQSMAVVFILIGLMFNKNLKR